MSVKSNLDKLKNQIGIKRCVILEGNVNDIYQTNSGYVGLKDRLFGLLREKGFNDIFMWDRIDGLSGGNLKNLTLTVETQQKSKEGEAYDFGQEVIKNANEEKNGPTGQFPTLAEFFTILRRNMLVASSKKAAFIADFSDYLFSNEQTLSEEERVNLISLSKAFRDKKFDQSEIIDFDTAIIFITNSVGKLPTSFYLHNPDVTTITLTKPNREEREKFILTNKNFFKITEDLNTDILKLQDIYDTMEGWTLKEVYQLIKFSNNISERLPFEKLLNSYQYGDKVSPWEEMNYEKLATIEKELKKRVIGQDHAIEKVKNVVYKAFTGLSGVQYSSKRTKPKGTLFFVGPTGVGKTELAKSLAKFLFGDEKNCIRFDMSEYNQEASDQKLIGAPPGYVGYEEGGQLTNAIKEKPFSVLLFDEIEKAHPRILDKFLQILEDGRLTDNKGQTVTFSDSFIIFTSNIGASEVDDNLSFLEIEKQFIQKVSDHFRTELKRPELLGRIGNNIIPFNFIKDINFKAKLITQKLQPIQTAVWEKYKIKLEFMDLPQILPIIIQDADDKKGGRDLLNSIEKHVVDGLSSFIFANQTKFKAGETILAQANGHQIEYCFK
ncbi:ATP-dependent Clp protease regulatory subunit [Spiroplasma kunkelii CR2-3x]|uniref:ATP-dependent Clp protease regulatory subunit n=1 Tax=Spiroplasma kunkelii CR2-3x TaxID=273035 RepID=A0A0K2JFK8_SPIKU|nr:AAA family ATPase [Spiroplasma kunkelii]ALA97031.1 ATP-dependent Clp protease regulatory subunit [Spiroplasma kunkelii CR2-3x]